MAVTRNRTRHLSSTFMLTLALGLPCLTSVQAAAAAPLQRVQPDVYRLLDETEGPVKVWVFFSDKGYADPAARERAIRDLEDMYNPRAIERRRLRRSKPGLFDASDLPVSERYIDAIEATGAEVHVRSRWLNGISATVNREQLAAIAAAPMVRRVQLVNRSVGVEPRVADHPDPGLDGDFYGEAEGQLSLINLITLHEEGYTGDGVVIGVLDTGFEITHEAFNHPDNPLNVIASYDFVNNDPNVGYEPGDDPGQHWHGTFILGEIASYAPMTLVGGAYDASFILCKTEDITGEYQAEEDYYVAGLEFIEANGGDVATSSLGYIDWYTQGDLDGRTAVTTIGVNNATANGVHCCTAAGNSGHDNNPDTSHLIAPADAFQVYTCGAVNPFGEIAGFSSDGPTADDRVKPEVMAQGAPCVSVDPFDDHGYGWASGTSCSTPLVAAAVACMTQAHPDWTVDEMRAHFFDTASYLGLPTPDPDFVYGYGIIDTFAASDLIQLHPVTPGNAGEVNEASVSYATPGELVYIVWGMREGSSNVPSCPGLTIDIVGARIAGSAVADDQGDAALSATVPPAAQGRDVIVQAVEPANCRRSSVELVTFN